MLVGFSYSARRKLLFFEGMKIYSRASIGNRRFLREGFGSRGPKMRYLQHTVMGHATSLFFRSWGT